MQRVLHLISQRPGWTGSGVALDAVVRAAADVGFDQRVVIGTPSEDPAPEVGGLAAAQIHPLAFDSPKLPFSLPGMSDVMPYRSSIWAELTREQLGLYREAWSDHVCRVVEEFEPDVIHSHHVWLLSGWVKDFAPSVPVVTHCHGTGLRQMQLCPGLADEVRAGCARNDAFLALHAEQEATIARELDIEAQRIHTIGSGYREETFYASGRDPSCGPVVTYAGKLSPAKGVPWLLDAIDVLASRIPGLVLHVAGSGSGEEADAIRARIDSADHVEYHGQLGPEALSHLLRRSAVFVLPSFYEGLPLALVEAAACGCRLVSTALPGVIGQLEPLLDDRLTTVALPRLENVDRPREEDLPAFVERLAEAIGSALSAGPADAPPTGVQTMTWRSVFERIEAVWRSL